MATDKFSRLKWWQIAFLSILVSALGGLSGGRSSRKEKKLYDVKLKQAPWAPPAWLFAPAWTLNNFFLLIALQKLIKSTSDEKKKMLLMQSVIWLIFFSFNFIYFNKKSPLLAAIWTLTDAGLAAASFGLSITKEKSIAYNYAPLTAWTAFASSVAVFQALKNPDPVFRTKALLN